jgi:tRNA-specific 2-thiouridylase
VTRRAPDTAREGTIVDEHGRVVGRHGGIHRFTVGQRKGLGISSSSPMYVLSLKPEHQQVVVGPKASLERAVLTASGVNWIEGAPASPVRAHVQIRHRHQPAAATVRATGDGHAEVVFDTPQIAVTPSSDVL